MSTAKAHPNIALVKYWGKADENLIIPVAGSMSMTLDRFATTTEVTLDSSDSFTLNGQPADPARVTTFLDLVREMARDAGLDTAEAGARVVSTNEGPTAAGMASSASGFAALALATSDAYGLSLDTRQLSRLARRGSGSASRSVIDRFAVWHAGNSDETSYAEQISAPEMAMIALTVNAGPKKVSSRAGMRATAATSPYYQAWIQMTQQILQDMLTACAADDFTTVGEITETHAHRMHALINSTHPPIRYLAPTSWEIFERVSQLRDNGLECYATADAGPNVVVISRPDDAQAVAEDLGRLAPAEIFAPGPGAQLLERA